MKSFLELPTLGPGPVIPTEVIWEGVFEVNDYTLFLKILALDELPISPQIYMFYGEVDDKSRGKDFIIGQDVSLYFTLTPATSPDYVAIKATISDWDEVSFLLTIELYKGDLVETVYRKREYFLEQ